MSFLRTNCEPIGWVLNMLIKRGALATGLLLAGLSAPAASAQDGSEPAASRTLQGAQAFLRETAESQALKFAYNPKLPPNAATQYGSPVYPLVRTATSSSECLTTLDLEKDSAVAIDWSKVSYVALNAQHPLQVFLGSSALDRGIPDQSGVKSVGFLLPTPAEAERVKFALEFLRTNCERKSQTGF